MFIGNTGKAGPVALSVCLALVLGCGGRDLHSVPAITGFTPAQATVGSTVRIGGSGFKDIDFVSFNGEPAASYHVDSDSQISAVLATNACSGPVSVRNPAGIDSSTLSFLVMPVVSGITPTSGPVGTTISVTGSGFFDASAVTLGGIAGSATFTYDDPNQVTVVVANGAVTGAVTLTTTPGLSSAGPVFTVTP